ncbi:MAG: hypothetical protein MZV70_72810 [Desulfobacterales bacterium]|nr:hypothetical protein [Desulfobacterales bacterium]
MADLKFKLIDKIVFQKIRDLFGGRLKGAMTGSAAMNPEISKFFFDIGIPLYDAYGTDGDHAGHHRRTALHSYRIGSVGPVMDKIKVVIDQSVVEPGAQDGEIIVLRPQCHEGLPQQAGGDRRDHDPGRRRPDGRPGPPRQGRVPVDHGPHQGAVQAGKRQVRLPRRPGGGHLPQPLRPERHDLRRRQANTTSA